MNCLLCHRTILEHEEDYCSTRHTDGEKVCPGCTALIRSGNRDALDALYGAKVVRP